MNVRTEFRFSALGLSLGANPVFRTFRFVQRLRVGSSSNLKSRISGSLPNMWNDQIFQNSIFSTTALDPFWDGPKFLVFSVCPRSACVFVRGRWILIRSKAERFSFKGELFIRAQSALRFNSAVDRTFLSPYASCLSGREAPMLLPAAGGF